MRWRGGRRSEDYAAGQVNAAMVALAIGDRDNALRALNDAASNTADPGRQHDIALILWQQLGEVRRAEALLRRAADTGSAHAMSALGVLLQQLNRPGEAEGWLRAAAKSGDADAVNNLGNLLERQGDMAGAVELWRKAAEAGSTMAMSSLALALFTHGRNDEARQWCERGMLLTAAEERADPAVIGKLTLVSGALANGDAMPEKPFPSGRTVPGEPVRIAGADDPLAVVAALHRTFLAERDPGVLDAALRASRHAVDRYEPGSPERAEALRIRGSLLRADYERKYEPALIEEAVQAGRAALDGARDDRARGSAQSSLGATLLIKHGVQHDDAALDQAIVALEEARRLLGRDDPEWPGITSTLGGALTQQHMRDTQARGSADTQVIDAAIGHLQAAIAATPPGDPELPARQYNLAMAKVQLGMQTQDTATLAQAATLMRQAARGLPERHPARAAAVRMLTALGGSPL